ncbi:MAG TPA: hypothetical protein PK095_02760 [Myxococcota bacterium]|nr:hypothetical protein [Myxococcota bacterium]
MAKQKFHLDTAKTQEILVQWKGIWKEVTVSHNGTTLGEPIPNMAELKKGRDYALPDGRTLNVKFEAGLAKNRLELKVDGRPVAGSGGDPKVQLKLAAGVIWFIAGLSILLGVLGMTGVKFIEQMGIGWPSVAVGVVMGVLAFFTAKKSQAALGVAIGIFAIDTVLTLMAGIDAGGRVPTTGIIVRVFLFIAMFQGFAAIKKVKEEEQLAAGAQAF